MDYKNLTDEELLDLIDKSFFNYLKFKNEGKIYPILEDLRKLCDEDTDFRSRLLKYKKIPKQKQLNTQIYLGFVFNIY